MKYLEVIWLMRQEVSWYLEDGHGQSEAVQ